MLTKVSEPNHLATSNIIKWCKENKSSVNIERIQDNLEGYLLIKYKSNQNIIIFNYYLNIYYSHNLIQIHWNNQIILKHIDSFDQNNWLVGNKLRTWVLNKIKFINTNEFEINNILGIGGEYYLYWIKMYSVKMYSVKKMIGISNHYSIISDANLNIPWSSNTLVDYNKLNTYPQINHPLDLILINLAQLNTNIVKYINTLEYKKIIIIVCNLPDSKLKLINSNFKIIQIKYFLNFTNLIRVMILKRKENKYNM